MIKKYTSNLLRFFNLLFFALFYGYMSFAITEGSKNYTVTVGIVLLLMITALNILFATVLIKKKKNVLGFFFITYLLSTIVMMGLEYYDLKYTRHYQITDSMLHFLGWTTVAIDRESFMLSRMFGFANSIVPIIVLFFLVVVFLCYLFSSNSLKKLA
ncbi:hypothetical protein [Cellulophaga sp. Z1A5H]|uniref:hypothetical protein n=1 Tax=Cellulophaga sp. Z1A5H TaxID=2687291 RepID=UPI0013FD2BC3|nr:hypothetical protein [Cellulophaga sp. Z1A5H]